MRCFATVAVLAVLAVAVACGGSAPSYMGSIPVSGGSSFIDINVDTAGTGLGPPPALFATASGTLTAVNPQSPLTGHSYTFPSSATNLGAGYWRQYQVSGALFVTSGSDKLLTLSCDSPAGNYGGSCSLNQLHSLTLSGAPSSTSWVKTARIGGGAYDILTVVGHDGTIAVVNMASPTPSLLNVTSIADAQTIPGNAVVTAVSSGADPAHNGAPFMFVAMAEAAGSSPGVIFKVTFSGASVSVSVPTFTLPTPDLGLMYNDGALSYVIISSYSTTNTTLTGYFIHSPKEANSVTFPGAGRITSYCAVAGQPEHTFYVVSNPGDGSPGSQIVYAKVNQLSSSTNFVSPAATTADQASTTASCQVRYGGLSSKNTMWLPVSGAIDVYQHAETVPLDAAAADNKPQRPEPRGTDAHMHISSSAPTVTECVDKAQGPTCNMACEPLPNIICGPGIAPPALVDGRPATCYILPDHPDACNFCPPEYGNFCP